MNIKDMDHSQLDQWFDDNWRWVAGKLRDSPVAPLDRMDMQEFWVPVLKIHVGDAIEEMWRMLACTVVFSCPAKFFRVPMSPYPLVTIAGWTYLHDGELPTPADTLNYCFGQPDPTEVPLRPVGHGIYIQIAVPPEAKGIIAWLGARHP